MIDAEQQAIHTTSQCRKTIYWEEMGKVVTQKAPVKAVKRIEKSIFARVAPDGRITAFQVKLFASGSKRSICESFDSLNEAQSFRDSVRADLALDPYKEKVLRARELGRAAKRLNGITLGDLLSDYLIEVTPTKKGAYGEGYLIAKIKKFAIAKYPVLALNTNTVRDFMKDLATNGRGMRAVSISKYLSTVSAVLKWGSQKLDHRLPNPVLDLPPNVRRTVGAVRTRRFRADEEFYLRQAFEQLTNPQMEPLFELALLTAARRGELLKLKWVDVYTDRLVATVRDTKNGDDRQLLLSPDAVAVLERLRSARVRSLDGRVFNLGCANIIKYFGVAKKAAAAAYLADCATRGIKPVKGFLQDLRWHDLRREAISTAAETCFDGQLDLQRFSGHREARSLRPYLSMQNDTALARTMPSRAIPVRTAR